MSLQPVDYVSGLGELPNPLKQFQQQQAFRVGLDAQRAETAQRVAVAQKAANEARRQAEFRQDLQAIQSDPSAANISALMAKYPEFADQLKASWDVKDKAARIADFTQLGEIWSALEGNNVELAAKAARARYEADLAAGQADDTDKAVVEALESGDPAKVKQAKAMIGMQVRANAGPEHFGSVSGALEPKLMAVTPGTSVIDERNPQGGAVFESPYRPSTITDPTTGAIYQLVPKASGAGATTGAPQATVGSVLASAGWPAHVVAGFLGNFDVEGGWEGAKGDGGKAGGIAQWHPDRIANYERAIGRPFDPADVEGQARFVLWEMQNPEAAGMTVEQRDAILKARSPQEAATLIDKFYERSSGKHRDRRIAAAKRYAQGGVGGPVRVRSKQEYDKLASGTAFIAPDGSLRRKP